MPTEISSLTTEKINQIDPPVLIARSTPNIMEIHFRNLISATLPMVVTIMLQVHFSYGTFGVNYGTQGDNLPSPSDVVNLYKQENITLMRIYKPDHDILDALRGSGIKVSLGVENDDVKIIALDRKVAEDWVNTNVMPYKDDVTLGWITLGNEMVPGPDASLVAPAMDNMYEALKSVGLAETINVSTVVSFEVVGVSYPPSAGEFSSEASEPMRAIMTWAHATQNPIFVTIYPYLAYVSDPENIDLGYAIYNTQKPPLIDGEYTYYSLFEAMVDAFYVAMEKYPSIGSTIQLVVAETGWPSAGNEPVTDKFIAGNYNQNHIVEMKTHGSPRRESSLLDIFIFSMFNEDLKGSGIEQNWGIFYPNMTHVYPLDFNIEM